MMSRVLRRLHSTAHTEVMLVVEEGPRNFRRLCVKKRQILGEDPELNAEVAAALAQEASVCARISHPAIVALHDLQEVDGLLEISLEYVDGPSLAEVLAYLASKGRSLPDEAALFIGARVFAALEAAHAARDPLTGEYSPIVHRDVTPGNVLLSWDGWVKLADFGAAKLLGQKGETRAGVLKGTFGYMAPEQVVGDPVTVRTDVYGGCLLLWEMLTGCAAFPQDNRPEFELLRAMAEPTLPTLHDLRADLPKPLRDAVDKGMQRDPEDRRVSVATLLSVIRAATQGEEARETLVEVLREMREHEPTSNRLSATSERPSARAGGMGEQSIFAAGPDIDPDATSSGRAFDPDATANVPLAAISPDAPSVIALERALEHHPTPASLAPLAEQTPNTSRAETQRPSQTSRRLMIALAIAATLAVGVGVALFTLGQESERTTAATTREPLVSSVREDNSPPNGKNIALTVPSASVSTLPSPSPSAPLGVPSASKTTARPDPAKSKSGAVGGVTMLRSEKVDGARVYLDGIDVGMSGNATRVPCGKHGLKIGRLGRLRNLDLPCGGEATLEK